MAKNNAVEIVNVTKTFKIPIEAVTMLKQKVVGFLLRKKGYRDFTPLKEISFNSLFLCNKTLLYLVKLYK